MRASDGVFLHDRDGGTDAAQASGVYSLPGVVSHRGGAVGTFINYLFFI